VAYLLALSYLACIYIRPAEIVAGLEAIPFAGIVAAASAVCAAASLVLRPRRFWDLPQDWFVLGFLLAIVASNAAWGWMGGAFEGLVAMGPAIFSYFLIRIAVESPRQLRIVGCTLVALTLWHAANGIVQFHTGIGLGGIVPIEGDSFSLDEGGALETSRIRGTGIFNDPNDLALTLVVAVPFLAGPLLRRSTATRVRVLASLLLIPIGFALYYTNSRGGMLGLGAALAPYRCRRFGKVAGAITATALLGLVVAAGPSRMANLDASESSAQGRVQSWAEGLQMLKAHPLFGVGFGRYTEFNELVAHNSLVHALGELGLLGSFFFVGMGYWFFHSASRPPAVDEGAWGEDLWQSGVAFGVCATFLSRQYNMLLFVWLALSSSYVRLMAARPAIPTVCSATHLARIAAITVAGVVCIYGVVRLFGNWSP
jgi:putative inorganic carbon (hco3(-)) transporter